MKISNTKLLFASLSSFILLPLLSKAASVELANGDILTGDITNFKKDTLTLKSAVAFNPLKINAESIQRILVSSTPEKKSNHREQITLANGDILPCNVLSLNDQELHIHTSYAGELRIPRNHLQSLQFGIQNQNTIYHSSEDTLKQWNRSDERTVRQLTGQKAPWTKTADDTFTCKGAGTLSRKFDLPENIRISFTLSWKATPNFVFRFCGENDSATTRQNTYDFVFNADGMQLRRYENSNHHGAPLANLPLKPSTFASRKINIEFIINRDTNTLAIYVDGNPVKRNIEDELDPAMGGHIIFNSRSSKNNFSIHNFKITQSLNGTVERHHETIRKSKSEIVVSADGDVLTGTIHAISSGNDKKRKIRFKQKNTTQDIQIPEHRLSSLHFPTQKSDPSVKTEYHGRLHGTGKLQVSNPVIASGTIKFDHPILGNISLNINALKQLKRN